MSDAWFDKQIARMEQANIDLTAERDALRDRVTRYEAFVAIAERYAPKPVTGCCDDDGACYPPEQCTGYQGWQEWNAARAAIDAQDGND